MPLIKRAQALCSRDRSLPQQPIIREQTPTKRPCPGPDPKWDQGTTNKGFPMDGDCPEVAAVTARWVNTWQTPVLPRRHIGDLYLCRRGPCSLRAALHTNISIEFYLITCELKPWPGQRWENKQGDKPTHHWNGSRERLVWCN